MDLQELDELYSRFEEVWNVDRPVCFTVKFLRAELSNKFEADILAELFMIDMQRRWQEWSSGDLFKRTVQQAVQELSGLPTYHNYLLIAAESGIIFKPTEIFELKKAELESRQQFGDLPNPQEVEPELRVELRKVNRPCASVSHSGQRVFESSMWGKLKVGRQSEGEPSSPCLLTDSDTPKLICAAGTDPSISRNQFLISVLARRHAIITNCSRNRAFAIDDEIALEPQAQRVVKFPFFIRLGHTTVHFERERTGS
jgi:hypothetical protein